MLADLAAGKREGALGTASVAADGTFTLALAAEDEAWLALDGRFLYSSQVQRVPAGETAIELAAELGGCLAGKLRLPEGVPAAALEKTDVDLGPDGEDFSMSTLSSLPIFPRGAEPDGEGRFGQESECADKAQAAAPGSEVSATGTDGPLTEKVMDSYRGVTGDAQQVGQPIQINIGN